MHKRFKIHLLTPDQIQYLHMIEPFQSAYPLVITFSEKTANILRRPHDKNASPYDTNPYRLNSFSMSNLEESFHLAFGSAEEIEQVYTDLSNFINEKIKQGKNVDFYISLFKRLPDTLRTLNWYLYTNAGNYLRFSGNILEEPADEIIEWYKQHAYIQKLNRFINEVMNYSPKQINEEMGDLFKRVMKPVFDEFKIQYDNKVPHILFFEPIFITNFQHTIIRFLSSFCHISVAYHKDDRFSAVFESVSFYGDKIVGTDAESISLVTETGSEPSLLAQYIASSVQGLSIAHYDEQQLKQSLSVMKYENREALVRYLNEQHTEEPIVAIRYKEITKLMEQLTEKKSIFDTSLGDLMVNILLMRNNQLIDEEVKKIEQFRFYTLLKIFMNDDFKINGKSAAVYVPLLSRFENVLVNCQNIDEVLQILQHIETAIIEWEAAIETAGYSADQIKQIAVHHELEWMTISKSDIRMIIYGINNIRQLCEAIHQNLSPGNIAELLNQFIEKNHYELSNEDEFVKQLLSAVEQMVHAYRESKDYEHLLSRLRKYFTRPENKQTIHVLRDEEEFEEISTLQPFASIQNSVTNSLDSDKKMVTIITADHDIFPLSQRKKLNFLDVYSIFNKEHTATEGFQLDKARMKYAKSISLYYLYHTIYFAEQLDISYEGQINNKTMFLSPLLQAIEKFEEVSEPPASPLASLTVYKSNLPFPPNESEYKLVRKLCEEREKFLKSGQIKVTRTWPELLKLYGSYILFFKNYFECITSPDKQSIEQPYRFSTADEAYDKVNLLFPMLTQTQKQSKKKEILNKPSEKKYYKTSIGSKSFLMKRLLYDYGPWNQNQLDNEGVGKVALCNKCQFRGACFNRIL